MLHALAHISIAACYVATQFGLDKSDAVVLHAAIYLLVGLIELAVDLGITRVGRWIGVLFWVAALHGAEIADKERAVTPPMVVCRSVAVSKPPRAV